MFQQVIQGFENIISKAVGQLISRHYFGEHPAALTPEELPITGRNWLESELRPLKRAIREHSIFSLIRGREDLKIFMSFHAFSVWEHLHLLQEFQTILRNVDRSSRGGWYGAGFRLVNQLLLEKETHLASDFTACSHFELYLEAMKHLEVAEQRIASFEALADGRSAGNYSCDSRYPRAVAACMNTHLQLLASKCPLRIAGYLFLGRESGCGENFLSTINALAELYPEQLSTLQRYLTLCKKGRADTTDLLIDKLFDALCGNDAKKWRRVSQAAELALHSRILLWDAACEEILKREISTDTELCKKRPLREGFSDTVGRSSAL